MGLPASEQRVLDTIETELQTADPHLTGAFAAFTNFTRNAGTPAAEQLGFRRWLILRRGHSSRGRPTAAFLVRLAALAVAGTLLALGTAIAVSAASRSNCSATAARQTVTVNTKAAAPGDAVGHACSGDPPARGRPTLIEPHRMP
jgi:hypothetical protein